MASTSKDPAARKQAVFWLGQSSEPRALDYLTKLLKQSINVSNSEEKADATFSCWAYFIPKLKVTPVLTRTLF